jgi:hypothetical protein
MPSLKTDKEQARPYSHNSRTSFLWHTERILMRKIDLWTVLQKMRSSKRQRGHELLWKRLPITKSRQPNPKTSQTVKGSLLSFVTRLGSRMEREV